MTACDAHRPAGLSGAGASDAGEPAAWAEGLGVEPEDLDDLIHDAVSSQASQIRGSRPATGAPAAPPALFDVTTGGLRHRLAPGMRAARDLSAMTSEHFSTETPCCGRRITLPIPGQDQARPAVCCHCHVLFAVALAREEADGFSSEQPHVAVFVVKQLDVAVARHRAGKWERHP